MCLVFFICSCANIVPPNGGEKDTSPPVLIEAKPPNFSLNFNANKIELLFDEYIEISNFDNIKLSPKCNLPPKILKKGKKIEISIDCTLAPQTTYTLHFGRSIVDLNENNAVNNLKYVFSTGKWIDSLWVKGSVSELYLDEKKSNILVYLTLSSDSLQSPYYYTFTNNKGEFILENVKADNYRICAVGDENNNLKYDLGELVSIPKQIEKFNSFTEIGLFNENTRDLKDVTNKYKNMIHFSHEPWVDSIKILNTIGVWNNNEKESSFWFTDPLEYIHYNWGSKYDSVLVHNVESWPNLKLIMQSEPHNIAKNNEIIIKSNIPIKNIMDTLFSWSLSNKPVLPNLINPFTIKIPCNINSLKTETLVVKSHAVESFVGSKSDSIGFVLNLNKEEFGTLNIKSNNKNENVYLELFNETAVIRKIKLNSEQVIKWIDPGNYRLRTYVDQNNNNFWDSGNLAESIESESIQIYPDLLQVRANWELDVIIENFE